MKPMKHILLSAFMLLFSGSLLATNIQLTKAPEIVRRDISGNKIVVRFSLSWDNSWNLNSPPNHDAAWVFMKYRAHGSDGFRHCNLLQAPDVVKGTGSDGCTQEYGESSVPNGHPATTGVFLSRAYKSIGTTTFNDVELEWDITGTGIDTNTILSVGVYAIEMVYVPIGEVSSPNVVSTAVNTKWPNGSSPFYIMKHEVTQAAWVDFLNTLDYEQQSRIANISLTSAAGTALPPANSRMMIKVRVPSLSLSTPAVFGVSQNGSSWDIETNGGNIPMFNLAWTDVTAYMDWACLRPLTEMEYEKAARGDQQYVTNELAWGNATLGTVVGTISNPYRPTEVSGTFGAMRTSPADANIATHSAAVSVRWPLRVGAFAGVGTTRQEAGASYWGVLNMSDNVLERYVNYSQAAGQKFDGSYHGDGNLSGSGLSNVETWPGQTSALANATGADGTGYKGLGIAEGASTTVVAFAAASAGVSARTHASNRYNSREGWTGARGGRTVFIPFSVLTHPAVTRRASTMDGVTGTGQPFPALMVKGVGGTTPYIYQWYINTTPDTIGATLIAGATDQTYTPLKDTAYMERYYYCVITDVEDEKRITNVSGPHTVLGVAEHPSTNVVTTTIDNVMDLAYLNIVPTGGARPYRIQWYVNTAANNSGGTQIVGASGQSYFPVLPQINTSYYFWCLITDSRGQSVRTNVSGEHRYQTTNFTYTGSPQTLTLHPGTYKMESWGARGGQGANGGRAYGTGGGGAYTAGILTLNESATFYIYVGQAGLIPSAANKSANVAGGWNGGGMSGNDRSDDDHGGSGGGATDIRTVNGAWNEVASLNSRIMVAGAGAGNSGSGTNAARQAGAGLTSADGSGLVTQIKGFAFGYGANGINNSTGNSPTYASGGGGGGYYGGTTGPTATTISLGGTSFISGHPGCDAVDATGVHTGQPNHFSKYVFTETDMRAGNVAVPNPLVPTGTTVGNTGAGYVRISRIK